MSIALIALASCTLPTLKLAEPDEPPLLPDEPATPTTAVASTGSIEMPATRPTSGPVVPTQVNSEPCSMNNGGCDSSPLAKCTNENALVQCTCPEGYAGNGLGDDGCTPTRTCMNDNGGCDSSPLAVCSEAADNNVNCVCPMGYAGTGLGADGCTDIDDCASNNGGCDTTPRATCTNTPGGRTCGCPSGSSGTGVGELGCADNNECLTNNGGCDTSPMASCMNTASGASCSCPSGYTGSGLGTSGCTDINECLTSNGGCDTSPMATCTNTAGGRTCRCPSGYTGSGIGASGCTDTNECATNNGGCDTAPMATCTNTLGGRTCSCPPGTGTELDGAESTRVGTVECARYWNKTTLVWDYLNQVTWEHGTQATYDGCRGTYHNRADGVAGEACTLAEARAYCANYPSDKVWRLPTRSELTTIVQTGSSPTISTATFGSTPATHFWTSTTADSTNSWYVCFCDGAADTEANTMQHDVRCVLDWASN